MRRTFRMVGLSALVVAIMALAIAGTVSAADNNPATGTQTQNQGAECLCGKCRCGECVCGDCDPINNAYNHDYSYLSPGPHGFQNGE
jgi:hypothetical protein